MEKEIDLILSGEDKEFSEENHSDTSYEDSDECPLPEEPCPPPVQPEIKQPGDQKPEEAEKKPEEQKPVESVPEKTELELRPQVKSVEPIIAADTEAKRRGKGDRLTSNQLALLHLRNLYSPEIKEIIHSSEKSILDLFDFVSGDILDIQIRPDVEDEIVGGKILKGAYLLNIIKDNFTMSLRRDSVSRFLAKAFEFLLNFDFNYGVAAKIVHILNQLKFRSFDLSHVAAMYKVTGGRDILIRKVFERTIYQTSNTKIAQDIKNYVLQSMLKLTSKINIVFTEDFEALYKYSDDSNLSFIDEGGVQFSYHFIPAKYLKEDDFNIAMNEVMFYRTTDIKMKSKATVSFLVRAVKNQYFSCTSEILQRIFYDARNLIEEIGKESELNADAYMADMGYILAHIPFSRNNSRAEFEDCLARVKGFFESIVDQFHPMTPRIFANAYYKKVFSNFVGTYCKQQKKYCSNQKIDAKLITDTLNPILRRITNFAVIGVYWTGLDEAIIDLCCLDEDYFLDDILNKILLSYNFDEFRKIDILRSIRNLSPFMRTEKTVQHLQWIIPKLTAQLDLSDSEQLALVSRALISIFQNFIKIEETKLDHLKPLLPMVEEANLKYIDFWFRKAGTFSIDTTFIPVMMALSPKCADRFKQKLFEALEDDFFGMKPMTAEIFVSSAHLEFPQEVETKIQAWVYKKVLKRAEKPASLSDIPLGEILKLNQIADMQYELVEDNEASLTTFLHVMSGLARNSWILSEETYRLCLTVFALASQSELSGVSRFAVKGFSRFFENYSFAVQGSSSTPRLDQVLEKDPCGEVGPPPEYRWVIPERVNPGRTLQMLETIFFETLSNCERLMQQIYTKGKIEATNELYVEQFFTSNLHKPISEDRQGVAENELKDSPEKQPSEKKEFLAEKVDKEAATKEKTAKEANSQAEAIHRDEQTIGSDPNAPVMDENENPSSKIGELALYLRVLADCLSTTYFHLLQMRSNRLRGVLEVFKKRLTFFLAKTDTYPRMKAAYLTLFHINNVLAANISFGNKQTQKLWSLGKSVLLNIRRANFNFQSELACNILQDYLPINNFCHYDQWLNIDTIPLDPVLFADYGLQEFSQNPDTFFWVFSKELCDYLFNKIITTFYRQAILYMQVYESKNMFSEIKELVNGSWLNCSSLDMVQFLLWTLINITTIDHIHVEKFNKTALYIQIVLEVCTKGYLIRDEETVFNFLQIGRQLITKGTYALTFPIYYDIIKQLLGWCNLPAGCNIDHMLRLLDTMNKRCDAETSVVDLLEVSTRFLLFYRSWTMDFRAKLVQYVLTHVDSKDINKRIIYMGLIAFLNRTLRRTDYVFKEVSVSQAKFLNQNGYVDMYMLKEVFREIRKNIGYSSEPTSIFNKGQLAELAKINENCIPTVVLPQYLSLPFKALSFELSDESTTTHFQKTLLGPEDTEKYLRALTDFISQLVAEYSQEIDEDTLSVKYEFAEMLIDTKGRFKFDKELQIFTALKISCMFLGFTNTKKLFDLVAAAHKLSSDSDGDYTKVMLAHYCALLGAAGYYTDKEFQEVLDMGRPFLQPFFTNINSKFLEAFIVHLNKSLRGNLSYKRLRLFFNMIREMMLADRKDHWVFYINVLIFQVTISQMILPDEWIQTFKEIMENANFNDITAAGATSRIFRSIYSVRMLISFNEVYIRANKRVFTEDTLSYHLYDREVVDFDDLVLDFLRELRNYKVWVKIEGIRHLIYILFDKKMTSHNLALTKKIFQILFTMDAVKDFANESVIPTYRGLIEDLRDNTTVQRNIKDQLLNMLAVSWQLATSYECLRGVLQVYRLGFGGKITEGIHKFLLTITKTTKLGLQDDIFIFMRDDILSKLPDDDLFAYARRLEKDYPPIVEKM